MGNAHCSRELMPPPPAAATGRPSPEGLRGGCQLLDAEAFGRNPAPHLFEGAVQEPTEVAAAAVAGAFLVQDSYLWSALAFTPPLRVRFRFTFLTEGELLSCFSGNREPWGGLSPDALSWYMATNRADFTFRNQMFGGFVPTTQHRRCQCELNRQYSMDCSIGSAGAQYSIDGEPYATCHGVSVAEGHIPATGHVGFAVYAGNEVKRICEVVVQTSDSLRASLQGYSRRGQYTQAASLLEELPPFFVQALRADGDLDVDAQLEEFRALEARRRSQVAMLLLAVGKLMHARLSSEAQPLGLSAFIGFDVAVVGGCLRYQLETSHVKL
jgi:hypothetical protein